jgi:hypothetical protein
VPNLDCVVRVRTNDCVNRVAGMHYEPIVGRAVYVLCVVGHRVWRIRHRQSGQFSVQITIGVLLLREYDKVRFARGLKRNDINIIVVVLLRQLTSNAERN